MLIVAGACADAPVAPAGPRTANRAKLWIREEDTAGLSADQRAAVQAIGEAPRLVPPLAAPAGAGKTMCLRTLAAAARRKLGGDTIVLAPTGKAGILSNDTRPMTAQAWPGATELVEHSSGAAVVATRRAAFVGHCVDQYARWQAGLAGPARDRDRDLRLEPSDDYGLGL